MFHFLVVPERTALINIDMQNCFVEGSPFSAPDGLEVLDRIAQVLTIDEMIRKLSLLNPSAVALQASGCS